MIFVSVIFKYTTVFICLGQAVHEVKPEDAIDYNKFGNFEEIQKQLIEKEKLLIFMGSGEHKIKRKAEQMACEEALKKLENRKKKTELETSGRSTILANEGTPIRH